MADNQITILPPPPIQSPTPVPAGTGNAAPSPSLASFSNGTILQGFIVNRDPSGNPVVRTDKGDVAFASNFFLKIGSEIVIRVANTQNQTLAHLLSVDGQSPEVAEHTSGFSQGTNVILSPNLSQTAQTGATLPTNAPSVTVNGTLITTPPSPDGETQSPVPAGTQLSLKVTTLTALSPQISEPPANLAQPATTAQATSGFYATYARAAATGQPIQQQTEAPAASETPVEETKTTVTTPQTAKVPTQTLPATTPQTATSQTPQAPAQTSLPTAPAVRPAATPGTSITATVIGSETTGEALVQTPLGVIRLQPGTQLPTGTKLTFEVVQSTPPETVDNPVFAALPQTPAPITELAQQWTALQQVFTLFSGQTTTTGLDEPLLQQPSATTQNPEQNTGNTNITAQSITTSLTNFLTAMRSGDMINWLGSGAVRNLQNQGKDELLKKLGSEFAALAKQFNEAQPNHWQPIFFPIALEGALEQVRLYVKRDRKGSKNDEDEKPGNDTRFVVEVDLSQLGELQMDGFVRKQDKDTQFDMVIRSLTPLPQDVQDDISRIYNDTGSITGYKGSILFQPVKSFPVNPMEDIAAKSGDVVV